MKSVRKPANPDGSKHPQRSPAQRIEATIARIPRGHVASYGQVAAMAGLPGRARMVARVLRTTEAQLPWFRVLRSDGCIAFPAGSAAHLEQRQRLQAEEVDVVGQRVNLRTFGWNPVADLVARELLGLTDDDEL